MRAISPGLVANVCSACYSCEKHGQIFHIPRLELRRLTNQLGGRMDYGHPCCCFHASCRFMSKALIALRSIQARNSSSPRRC